MALNISGVDEGIFNDLMDGDEALYITILQSFVGKTPEVIKKLATVSKETLPEYANNIHAFKGACANICAEEARKTALKLEQMAKAGDLSGVLAENGPFLKYIDDLMVKLKDWLSKHE